jgi:predicted MFS family arabinose efflux permease
MSSSPITPAYTSTATDLKASTVFAMAAACGLAVANIYYNQPMLALIEQRFAAATTVGLVPTSTQLGYALGLFFLVPLGDLVERKRLIVTQFLVLTIALAAAALAPGPWFLVIASFFIGTFATVAQQIVPLAVSLSRPERRGRTIGKVTGGVLCGILLSRTLSGFVATYLGWRAMFFISIPMALFGAALMVLVLPRTTPTTDLRYPALLHSLHMLWSRHPGLRRSAFTQAAVFGSFISFWTILSLHLAEPRYGYGPYVAGLFGIVGAVGVVAAPLAGHIADRRGPHLVIIVGALLSVVSWAIFGFWASLVGLVVGVVVLDFAVQSSLVSNQHIIYAIDESARSRINTLFMSCMFVGGALGSITSTYAWHRSGWTGTCIAGAIFAVIALLLQHHFFRAHRSRSDSAPDANMTSDASYDG